MIVSAVLVVTILYFDMLIFSVLIVLYNSVLLISAACLGCFFFAVLIVLVSAVLVVIVVLHFRCIFVAGRACSMVSLLAVMSF